MFGKRGRGGGSVLSPVSGSPSLWESQHPGQSPGEWRCWWAGSSVPELGGPGGLSGSPELTARHTCSFILVKVLVLRAVVAAWGWGCRARRDLNARSRKPRSPGLVPPLSVPLMQLPPPPARWGPDDSRLFPLPISSAPVPSMLVPGKPCGHVGQRHGW